MGLFNIKYRALSYCFLIIWIFVSHGCSSVPEVKINDGAGYGGGDILLEEKRQLAKLYLRLGETYYLELDDYQRAKEYFLNYLKIAPGGEGADLARRRLAEIDKEHAVTPEQDAEEKKTPSEMDIGPAHSPSESEGSVLEGVTVADYYGEMVSLSADNIEGTIIFFWRDMTSLNMDLLNEIALFGREKWAGAYRIFSATPRGSQAMAVYLKDKGIYYPLLDDSDGLLADAIGVNVYPALAVIDGGGRLFELFQGWQGSGLSELIKAIKLENKGLTKSDE